MAMGLYQVNSPLERAQGLMGQAASSYASMTKHDQTTTTSGPGKTIGGMLGSAAGMGLAGGMAGSMMTGAAGGSALGLPGMAVGAALGALAYYLS